MFLRPRVDAVERADAVVVLDGDQPRRLSRGISLVASGCAPVLVVVNGETVAPELVRAGNLPFEVLSFVPVPFTTRGEAGAVAALVRERGWRKVVVVTSTYHITRTRIVFERAVDADLRFVPAGYSRVRLPLHVASEWAKLAFALALRRPA